MVNVHFYCYVNLINLPITLCAAQQWQINFWLRSLRLFANVKSYEPKCHAQNPKWDQTFGIILIAHRAAWSKNERKREKSTSTQRHSLFHWLSIALWDSIKFNEHRINSCLSLTVNPAPPPRFSISSSFEMEKVLPFTFFVLVDFHIVLLKVALNSILFNFDLWCFSNNCHSKWWKMTDSKTNPFFNLLDFEAVFLSTKYYN